jgi:hypothetical protein
MKKKKKKKVEKKESIKNYLFFSFFFKCACHHADTRNFKLSVFFDGFCCLNPLNDDINFIISGQRCVDLKKEKKPLFIFLQKL